MDLKKKAKDLAQYLSKIEDRLLNTNPDDVTERHQLFMIAMDKCTHCENQFGSTGVSLLNVMEKNQLDTGSELYRYLYSELPTNIDGKTEINPMIRDAAKQISEIKDGEMIYKTNEQTGDIKPATDSELKTSFDRLIKACYTAAAKASIR